MFPSNKLKAMDLSNYYTKNQCDNLFLSKFDAESVDRRLTSLEELVSIQDSSITTLETNLYEPLLNSGNTKINLLSGLTDLIASSTTVNPLVNFTTDPFFGVINLNTTLTNIMEFTFGNMPCHIANNMTTQEQYKTRLYGRVTLKPMIFPSSSLSIEDQIGGSCNLFDFEFDYSQFQAGIIAHIAFVNQVFIPDKIFNLYDGKVYLLNYCTSKSLATKINNESIKLNLWFRNHISFDSNFFIKHFAVGNLMSLYTTLIFLKPLEIDVYNVSAPNILVNRTFMKLGNRGVFDALGIKHKNFFYLPDNQDPALRFEKLFSDATPKRIGNFNILNNLRTGQSSWVKGDVLVKDMQWKVMDLYPETNYTLWCDGSINILGTSEGVYKFISYCNKLANM